MEAPATTRCVFEEDGMLRTRSALAALGHWTMPGSALPRWGHADVTDLDAAGAQLAMVRSSPQAAGPLKTDFATRGLVPHRFLGSAVISAVFWEHDVLAPSGTFERNLVGLGKPKSKEEAVTQTLVEHTSRHARLVRCAAQVRLEPCGPCARCAT